MINTCQYIKASQLKIVKDIHSSDSILLQNEFGIDLPPEAEITRLGYCADEIVIRIEGVEDLDSFLTDSLHLELDSEESQELSEDIIKVINSQRDDMYEDMYGTKRIMTFFLNFKYQTQPLDSSAKTSFFLLDGKIVIENSKTDTTTENREAIKEIVNR
jgi:hypothetical protein